MDNATLEGYRKFLPNPATHPENEYCYNTTALNKESNKIVEVKILFRKDPLGKQWDYIETLAKKNSTLPS